MLFFFMMFHRYMYEVLLNGKIAYDQYKNLNFVFFFLVITIILMFAQCSDYGPTSGIGVLSSNSGRGHCIHFLKNMFAKGMNLLPQH